LERASWGCRSKGGRNGGGGVEAQYSGRKPSRRVPWGRKRGNRRQKKRGNVGKKDCNKLVCNETGGKDRGAVYAVNWCREAFGLQVKRQGTNQETLIGEQAAARKTVCGATLPAPRGQFNGRILTPNRGKHGKIKRIGKCS